MVGGLVDSSKLLHSRHFSLERPSSEVFLLKIPFPAVQLLNLENVLGDVVLVSWSKTLGICSFISMGRFSRHISLIAWHQSCRSSKELYMISATYMYRPVGALNDSVAHLNRNNISFSCTFSGG